MQGFADRSGAGKKTMQVVLGSLKIYSR